MSSFFNRRCPPRRRRRFFNSLMKESKTSEAVEIALISSLMTVSPGN